MVLAFGLLVLQIVTDHSSIPGMFFWVEEFERSNTWSETNHILGAEQMHALLMSFMGDCHWDRPVFASHGNRTVQNTPGPYINQERGLLCSVSVEAVFDSAECDVDAARKVGGVPFKLDTGNLTWHVCQHHHREGQYGGTMSLGPSWALQHISFHSLEINSDWELCISFSVFVIKVTIKYKILVSETVGGHSQADSFSTEFIFNFCFSSAWLQLSVWS